MNVQCHLVVDQEIGEVDDGLRGNVVEDLQRGRHGPRVNLEQVDVVNPVANKMSAGFLSNWSQRCMCCCE